MHKILEKNKQREMKITFSVLNGIGMNRSNFLDLVNLYFIKNKIMDDINSTLTFYIS